MAKSKGRGRKAAEIVLQIPVSFGNVNIGDETARLGVSVERRHLSLAQADKFLCNKRLTATVRAEAGKDHPEQPPLLDAGTELEAAWDTHSFGVSKKKVSFGLTCVINSIDVKELAGFAKRGGSIIVSGIGDIPENEADGEEGDEEE